MSIVPLMILVSLLVVIGAAIAFFWAVGHDQFEDLESPAFLPMFDDSPVPPASSQTTGAPARDITAAGLSPATPPSSPHPAQPSHR
ncbi:MAG: cbb3-type cytochrome oxidase assembly protein [Burkholderiales bacterium]|nr:cbb3-type cytochrome oxidase assembly protein [Burkholderiales bacterium]